ncbi:hypothetical protein CBS101457_006458 [Exobasidium rhododendri]|nr:hypothetical protein CBS101457_006458 [Exobasidium rhododendri]
MAEDEDAKYAQALRFLISLQSQKHQDIDSQRSFLQSKGLSEELIARALQNVKRPDSIAEDEETKTRGGERGADSEAFEKATRLFDEPLSAEQETTSQAPVAPPKTYPTSPLALYQAPQGQQAFSEASISAAAQRNSPTTRYDVLLSFFRSLCYFFVLGGGVTGVAVALYRTYMLPRLMSTLDTRSLLLKHHLDQYSRLTKKVKSLRGNSLAPTSQRDALVTPLKGVLKKVQFADEVPSEASLEEEDKKEAGEKLSKMDASTVEKEGEKQSLLGAKEEDDDEEGAGKAHPQIQPVDVLEPIRHSLTRLTQALRADKTASAIGSEIYPAAEDSSITTATRSPTATTLEEESDAESWVSEEDSDELEFDPYSSSSTLPSSKRKHDPANTGKKDSAATNSGTSSTSANSLNSSLSTMNAYVNSQIYMANSHAYSGRMLGMGGFGNAGSNNSREDSKAGDVAQIRADIRNLKGLLLSRRNFPAYRTSPPVTAAANTPV